MKASAPDQNLSPQAARVARLIRALEDPHVSVIWNASRELAKLGPAARPALPPLTRALQHRDPTTALWARYAISQITGDIQQHLSAFIDALDEKSGVFPGMASAAIAGCGAAARDAVPFLIPQLSSSEADNRWGAAGALARIGASAAPAVPALIEALNDIDEKVRWYAAWALAEIGPNASAAVPALVRALDDIDDDVRGYAARALGRIGPAASVSLPALHSLLNDDNAALRSEVESALAAIVQAE